MTRIIIRCDASMLVGSGHVMRCLTLARHLKSRGSEVFFICRRQPGDLIGMLETEFSVLTLPEQSLVDVEGLKGRQLYQAWLGCTQDQDAIESLQALADFWGESRKWTFLNLGVCAPLNLKCNRNSE